MTTQELIAAARERQRQQTFGQDTYADPLWGQLADRLEELACWPGLYVEFLRELRERGVVL